jgi:phosphatidylglycerol:prolipoprotein diacylglycerol transferase
MTDNIALPISLNIGEYNIDLGLIGVVLFSLVFLITLYIKLSKSIEIFEGFDFAFRTLIVMVITSRLLAIINNPNYYLSDLSQIINFQDGRFFYPGMLLGLIISVFFMSASLAKRIGYMNLLDATVKAYAYSALFLLFGYFLSARSLGIEFEGALGISYLDGIIRFPSPLIQVLYTLVAAVILLVLPKNKTKSGIVAAIFIMLFSTVEFILRFFANGYDPIILGFIDLYQFIYLILLTFSILIFIRVNQIQRIDERSQDFEVSTGLGRTKFDISGFKKERVSAKEIFSLSYGSVINNKDNKATRTTK